MIISQYILKTVKLGGVISPMCDMKNIQPSLNQRITISE